MRHNVSHRKLGRVTEHRLAMLRNQAISLLRHERIETTIPKAKELRPFVERIITIAKRGLAAGDANAQTLNARRLVMAAIPDAEVVRKLFSELAPRFEDRAGGYTRILRIGFRRGDAAEVAQIELVGSEWAPSAVAPTEDEDGEAPKKSKGLGERLRQTARNLRGGDKGDRSKPPAKGQTQGGRKSTTPRKVGGS